MSSDLSRRSSRQPILPDDTTSLTSFPDPTQSETASPALEAVTSPHIQHAVSPDLPLQPLTALLDDGPSMFDDQDADADDPQSLSASSNQVLRNIIDHRGAVELVRHLSALLAQRDAHVTALTRLAEEYEIPASRLAETADRVKQAERRRLSLAAASEDLAPTNVSDSSEASTRAPVSDITTATGTIRGLTKLFGGAGKRKESLAKPASSVRTASSSRSNSIAPPQPQNLIQPKIRTGKPQSIDVLSITSADSVGWTSNIFGAGPIKGITNLANGSRRDSRSSREPREPVEMSTRHDPDQLPPTLTELSPNDAKNPQELEWNKFLLRLMKMRQQAGEEAKSGEYVGAARWGHEGSAGKQKMEALTRLILAGIPMRLRQTLWMELSNTHALVQPDAYKHYLELRESEDPNEIDAILKDVPRTLTSKYDYYADRGYDRLKRVLVAFVGKYPGLGYTQGLNMIAGYLLLAIPGENDAFWLLCNMVDNFFPPDYFSRETAMSAPITDNIVLRQYVKELMPKLSDKLAELNITPEHTVPLSWFLTAFANVLPEVVLLRIWDVWLCVPNQKTFLFNVALTLLAQHAKELIECENEGEYYSYMGNKIKVSEEPDKIHDLIRQAFMMRKKLEQVELRRTLAMKKLRKPASTEALYGRDSEEGELA